MLATPADPPDAVPGDGATWAYEVKWDGMRLLADVREGRLRLTSRTERVVTVAFPELAWLADAHPDVLLDGEVVVLRDGVPSFAALADRFTVREAGKAAAMARKAPATFMPFDVLRLYAVDLMPRPWQERRDVLERLDLPDPGLPLSPAYDDGPALMAATREQGLEGIVAKRRTSIYRPGVRSPDWVKLPHRRTQSCVIGGWRPETSGRDRIGGLLLGVWDVDADGRRVLRFAGRAGSGLTEHLERHLRSLLRPADPPVSPFGRGVVPRVDAAGAVWVEPDVVVEVRHIGRTEGGRLRQPVLLGVRTDLDAAELA